MTDSSTLVSVKISGYEKPVVYTNLVVEQPVLDHHRFSFLWNAGGFKADTNFQLDVLSNYIGQQVTVQFSDSNIFVGIITDVTIDERNNASQSFMISGYSPSYLLEDAPRSCTFYKKSLEQVAKAILEGVQGNLLKTKVTPETKDSHHYISQYNETDFQFLSRLAIRYGEWFYYNGNELVFGGAGDSGGLLENGVDLDRMTIKANLVPNKFSYSGYDYFKGEKLAEDITALEAPSNNSFASKTATVSKDVFARTNGRTVHVFNVINKQQIDQFKETDNKRLQSNLITVRGESKNTGLKAGCRFKIKSNGSTTEYTAIQIVHISNRSGHYENSFTAIPASVKVPHYANPRVVRKSGIQTATVKENHDKDGLNRIKVQFHWQASSDMTPWIRVATPHAGSGKGMHFIPEKGEEVIVGFEGGDIDKPFVMASHYNGGAKSGSGDADNNAKSLITKGGIKLVLDDSKKSVMLSDGSGNSMNIDGSGNISISSSATIKLACGDSSMVLKKDGTIVLDGKNIMLTAKSDIVLDAGADTSVSAKQNLSLGGEMKVAIAGKTSVEIQSNTKVSVFSASQLELIGSLMNTITGGIVKIN